jgi:hypothetical protein
MRTLRLAELFDGGREPRRDFGPQPYGGKRRFDWVGRAQMNPVLGRLCGLAGYVVMAKMKKENRELAAARTWARR